MRRPLPLLVLPFLLVSCGFAQGDIISSIPTSFKEGSTPLLINGDLYGKEDLLSYRDVLESKASLTHIKAKLEMGETIFLYATQDTCRTCVEIEPTVLSFFEQTKVFAYGFYNKDIAPALTSLAEKHPTWGMDISKIGTPYGVFLTKNEMKPLHISKNGDSPVALANHIFENSYRTSIVRFTNYDAYASWKEQKEKGDFFVYAKEESDPFYADILSSGALTKNKTTVILEYDLMDKTNKELFAENLGIDKAGLLLHNSTILDTNGQYGPATFFLGLFYED